MMGWLGSQAGTPGGGGGEYQLPLVHVVVVSHNWTGLEPYSHASPGVEQGVPFIGRL
jgi:hypothetical protein